MRNSPGRSPLRLRTIKAQAGEIERLKARVDEVERRLGENSGNSAKPLSRDPVAERQRQAEERAKRSESQAKRRRVSSAGPEVRRWRCRPARMRSWSIGLARAGPAGAGLDDTSGIGHTARQVVDLPEIKPVVSEHRAVTCRCSCGTDTTADFPDHSDPPCPTGRGCGPWWPICWP